jgi:hypothetical protein
MDAIQIMLPIITLLAYVFGACLFLLILAALVGKFFGGFLR